MLVHTDQCHTWLNSLQRVCVCVRVHVHTCLCACMCASMRACVYVLVFFIRYFMQIVLVGLCSTRV